LAAAAPPGRSRTRVARGERESRIVVVVEQVRWLTPREMRVWRLLAALLVVLPDAVEAQLQRDGALTQFGYGVLSALSEAPSRSMRMTELAYLAHGSQSRLSHVMAGLERRGWVRRERAAEDGRGNIAVLTDAGYAKVEAVAPGHVATVRAAVFDALRPRQLDELEEICAALLPPVLRERKLRHQNDDRERPQTEDGALDATPETSRRDDAANKASWHPAGRHQAGRRETAPADALTRLLAAVRGRADDRPLDDGRPAADPGLADGLALLSEARRDIDFAELELIDRARARGQTWQQIAAALALPDRRQAQTRYRRLRERWPQYNPTAPV